MSDISKIISAYGSDPHCSMTASELDQNWEATPSGSAYATSRQSAATLPRAAKRKFKSYRLRGPYEKPWLSDPAMKKTRWNNWIVMVWVVLGFAGAGVICYLGVRQYKPGPVCPPRNDVVMYG